MAGENMDAQSGVGPFLAETPRQMDVLRLIRDRGVLTRTEIGDLLHASASQVSRLTAPLIARKVVTVEPRLPYVEGRPTELLALAEDTHYVVGLDVGGLAQDAVTTNLRGDIVGSATASELPTDSRASIIAHLVDLAERAIEDAKVPADQILGVGVGVRAIIDPVSGVITAGPETPSWLPVWGGFDVRDQLASALPWDRLVINDTVRALAAAEHRYGKARGIGDFVYVLADSGIGAALMIDGKPYIGPGHLAGEVGHIVLDHNGPLCGCGRRGCVEMYASTSSMIAQGRRFDPTITAMQDLIDRADAGNIDCRHILEAGGAALGRAIAILLNLLSPALVVIGGRATSAEAYMESARTSARLDSLDQPFQSAAIVSSDSRSNAGAQGAATLILDSIFGSDMLGASPRQRAKPSVFSAGHLAGNGGAHT